MTTSNVERMKDKYTFYWSHQQILKDDQPMKREDAVAELNRLTERVAELEKERDEAKKAVRETASLALVSSALQADTKVRVDLVEKMIPAIAEKVQKLEAERAVLVAEVKAWRDGDAQDILGYLETDSEPDGTALAAIIRDAKRATNSLKIEGL